MADGWDRVLAVRGKWDEIDASGVDGTRAWALQAEEEGPCMALDEKYHRLTAVMPELQEVGGHLTTLAGLTSRDTGKDRKDTATNMKRSTDTGAGQIRV